MLKKLPFVFPLFVSPFNLLRRSQGCHATVKAWEDLLSDWPRTQTQSGAKLRCLLKKGVPRARRRDLWLNLLGCRQLQQSSRFNYKVRTLGMRLLIHCGTKKT